MRESYPTLDIVTEFNKMAAWCSGGDAGCYSGTRVSMFAWRWLERAQQDKARGDAKGNAREKDGRFTADDWETMVKQIEEGTFE